MVKTAPGSLDDVLAGINKDFGPGSIMKMGENPHMDIEVVSTGLTQLDVALGAGGYPRGRIVEIYGPFASGKSSLAMMAVAEAQQSGLLCAYVDAEYGLDRTYAAALGVDIDNLLISQPSNGNEALEIVDRLVKTAAVGLVVVDSVAALVPRAEIEGEMGDAVVGLHARLMSQALRKITSNIGNGGTTVIFINQLREKIGVMYGSPEVTTGGRALAFYSSVRLDVRRKETLKADGESYANRVKIKVVKNRVGPPFRECEVDLIFGKGFSKAGSLLDAAVDLGIAKRSGAWYTYEGEQLGQGRSNAAAFLEENEATYKAISDDVHKSLEAA